MPEISNRMVFVNGKHPRKVTWRQRAQNKSPNMVKLEQNPGYFARPPVFIWRSRPVAKSAHWRNYQVNDDWNENNIFLLWQNQV